MRSYSPSPARKSRYASAVVAKPPGTLTPRWDRFETISPSEAFLPPTWGTSAMPISVNQRMFVMCVSYV